MSAVGAVTVAVNMVPAGEGKVDEPSSALVLLFWKACRSEPPNWVTDCHGLSSRLPRKRVSR